MTITITSTTARDTGREFLDTTRVASFQNLNLTLDPNIVVTSDTLTLSADIIIESIQAGDSLSFTKNQGLYGDLDSIFDPSYGLELSSNTGVTAAQLQAALRSIVLTTDGSHPANRAIVISIQSQDINGIGDTKDLLIAFPFSNPPSVIPPQLQ
jgi:hypothetical protein